MSLAERIIRVSVAIVYIALAVYAFRVPEWHLRGNMTAPRGVHLFGWPKHLLALAMCSGAISLLSLVVLHYRASASEKAYRWFARLFGIAGWTLFAASFVLYAYQYSTK
jgi:hypothetical protein